MKKCCSRITVVLLLILASITLPTRLSEAQDSRSQISPRMPSEKPVEQVFKNIKVLKGMPQSQLYPTMRFMAASLGFQCGSCHVIKNFIDAAADDKPEKQTARQMIKMVIDLKQQFQGNPAVTCYTCHRGLRAPQGAPLLPLPIASTSATGGAPAGMSTGSLQPSADDVLNKYLAAIGGAAATERITSCALKGTTTTAIGPTVAYESEQSVPDKGHEVFTLPTLSGRSCAGDSRCEYERVINGRQGWLKSGAGVQELVGEQLGDQKSAFLLFQILRLKDQYASFRYSGHDRMNDRGVNVLDAVRSDGKSERLYFDIESGLLRRRISYLRTLIAAIPQQTDFEDYRDVDGLKVPFTITMAYVDAGSQPIVRRFSEIKLNVPIPESKFEKPR